MKVIVAVAVTVPLSVCDENQRSVEEEPVRGLGETLHARELSHQYATAELVRADAKGWPSCVQLRVGADGDPFPIIEYE